MDDEVLASDVIKENTKAFAKQILSNLFPNVIDGLKKVKRRILYTQPIEGTFSGLLLISNAIKIHPYGDSSVYSAACRMTEPFHNNMPLIELIGNGGSYSGKSAASSRYTEFQLTDFCRDIFFTGVNFKTIPMELTEDFKGHEIQYFIPKLPTALLYDNESIGFGYSSRTIPLKFENVCDLVIDFVKCKDKINWNYSRLAHLFIPHFPIDVYLRNVADLVKSYRQGDFETPVMTEGVYVLKANNVVLIRTLAYGISPEAIRSNLTTALKDKNHRLTKSELSFKPRSENANYFDLQLTIKRGANIFDLIEEIKGFLRIRSPVYPINNFVFNEKMHTLNPPQVIKMWYKERYRSIFSAKKHRQQELLLIKMKLMTYLIVCEHVSEVIDIIREEKASVEDVHRNLKTRFELSTRQCDILLASNLQILMRSKRDELEEKLAKVETELTTINNSFEKIDHEIQTEVAALKKKYKTKTTTSSRESEYIGALIVGDLGIVQVSSITECIDTAKLFNDINHAFIPYYSGVKMIRFAKYSNVYNNTCELPATINSSGINIKYADAKLIFARSNGRSQCLSPTAMLTANRAIINPISDDPWVILTNGKITKAPVELFDTRKSAGDVLYAFDGDKEQPYIVISVNVAHPNVIRFQLLKLSDKVLFSGAGESAVIAVVPYGTDELIVNLPSFHKQSICHITDINKAVSKHKLIDINIRAMNKI